MLTQDLTVKYFAIKRIQHATLDRVSQHKGQRIGAFFFMYDHY
uniref:Uncharacterized protein MANES_16G110500 n=1 Tax=Rhizophora mucronata TaxID=61149 RepID=A0A2P2KAU8_RHIMU